MVQLIKSKIVLGCYWELRLVRHSITDHWEIPCLWPWFNIYHWIRTSLLITVKMVMEIAHNNCSLSLGEHIQSTWGGMSHTTRLFKAALYLLKWIKILLAHKTDRHQFAHSHQSSNPTLPPVEIKEQNFFRPPRKTLSHTHRHTITMWLRSNCLSKCELCIYL